MFRLWIHIDQLLTWGFGEDGSSPMAIIIMTKLPKDNNTLDNIFGPEYVDVERQASAVWEPEKQSKKD